MKQINAAVVGTGFIGPVHVEALRRAGVNVIGLLGSASGNAPDVAAQLGIPRAYASLEELLADGDVHSVHVATPNRLHYEMAKRVILAEKHLMCEKPMAMNSSESSELVALAGKAKVACGVNYNIRYYPLCREAKERVRTGQVGKVFSIVGSYVQDWLMYPTDYNWRVLAEAGGDLRAVADIGTHWMDLVFNITGVQVESVFADLATFHPTRHRPLGEVQTFSGKDTAVKMATEPVAITTDDHGAILFRFQGGGRGMLHVSQVTAGRKNRLTFEIAGSKNAMAWESERPNELWIGHRDQANESLIRDPALLSAGAKLFTSYPGGHNEGFADTFKQLYIDFYGYIRKNDWSANPEFPTFSDGHREVQLCEAILTSHRESRWVSVLGGQN